jgi:Uma2 family endonuclease
MTVHAPLTMTKDVFLAWVVQREERYELAGGRVVMMVQVTRNHSVVTGNLFLALRTRLEPERHDVAVEVFAVHIGDTVRFPDLLVEPAQTDGKAMRAKAPLFIAEILSPGTLHVDFGDKKREYLSLPTLQAYLVPVARRAACGCGIARTISFRQNQRLSNASMGNSTCRRLASTYR